jgi:hypothetical protein
MTQSVNPPSEQPRKPRTWLVAHARPSISKLKTALAEAVAESKPAPPTIPLRLEVLYSIWGGHPSAVKNPRVKWPKGMKRPRRRRRVRKSATTAYHLQAPSVVGLADDCLNVLTTAGVVLAGQVVEAVLAKTVAHDEVYAGRSTLEVRLIVVAGPTMPIKVMDLNFRRWLQKITGGHVSDYIVRRAMKGYLRSQAKLKQRPQRDAAEQAAALGPMMQRPKPAQPK